MAGETLPSGAHSHQLGEPSTASATTSLNGLHNHEILVDVLSKNGVSLNGFSFTSSFVADHQHSGTVGSTVVSTAADHTHFYNSQRHIKEFTNIAEIQAMIGTNVIVIDNQPIAVGAGAHGHGFAWGGLNGAGAHLHALNATWQVTTIYQFDSAKFTVSDPVSYQLPEDGGSQSVMVVLDAAPNSDVVINIASSAPDDVTVDRSSVTFTASNWDVPQTVSMSAVDNSLVDGFRSVPVIFSVDTELSDPVYATLDSQS